MIKLNYKVVGEGQPVIILHGLFGSLDNWMTLAKAWSEEYKVWILDQRNHGQSPHTDEFSYELMANDLNYFIEEYEIKNPIVIGHSMGGKTAMRFAHMFPEKLRELIVVDIAPVNYQVHHYSIIDAMESLNLADIKDRKQADMELSVSIGEFGVRQFLLKNLYRSEKNRFAWRFNLPVLKKEIVPISQWDSFDGLYQGETLFIKGGKSDYIKPDYISSIESQFPNHKLQEIPNAGHWGSCRS